MRSLLLALAFVGCLLAGCADPGAEGAPGPEPGTAPAPEAGIVVGRLTAAAAAQAISMPLSLEGHGRLAVTLVMTTNLPESTLSVRVSGPDGREAEGDTGPLLYAFPGTRPTLSFADPPVATWTADVELTSGAAADFELHWCADEQDAPGPAENFACHHY